MEEEKQVNPNEYKFSMDFNVGKGAMLNMSHLVQTYGIPTTYIEVGVFEGSTLFWLSDAIQNYNKSQLKIYAIDPHVGSNDMSENFTDIRNHFIHNLFCCRNKNIEYMQKHSKVALRELIDKKVQAELIYIDGDHKAGEVLSDLVLAWECLKVGGVMLCDDTTTWKYKDENGTYSNHMSPRLAVESFIQCNWNKINILNIPDGSQTAFIKTLE